MYSSLFWRTKSSPLFVIIAFIIFSSHSGAILASYWENNPEKKKHKSWIRGPDRWVRTYAIRGRKYDFVPLLPDFILHKKVPKKPLRPPDYTHKEGYKSFGVFVLCTGMNPV